MCDYSVLFIGLSETEMGSNTYMGPSGVSSVEPAAGKCIMTEKRVRPEVLVSLLRLNL